MPAVYQYPDFNTALSFSQKAMGAYQVDWLRWFSCPQQSLLSELSKHTSPHPYSPVSIRHLMPTNTHWRRPPGFSLPFIAFLRPLPTHSTFSPGAARDMGEKKDKTNPGVV